MKSHICFSFKYSPSFICLATFCSLGDLHEFFFSIRLFNFRFFIFFSEKTFLDNLLINGFLLRTPTPETPRHGDIVADTDNVLRTFFVYINENSFKNCLQLLDSLFTVIIIIIKKNFRNFCTFSPAAMHNIRYVFLCYVNYSFGNMPYI